MYMYLKNTFVYCVRSHCLPEGRATCRSVPGLTKDQLELCFKASDVATAALEGLDMAIRECQQQVIYINIKLYKKK